MSLKLDKSRWTRVKFGEVVFNVNISVRDAEAAGIDRVIAMEHLDPGELRIQRWGNVADGTTFTRLVKPGQTLFGKRRAYQRKVAYAEFEAICSGDILTFQADEARLLPEFLPFLVQSDRFFEHALGTSAGSLSPRTNWTDLSNFEFDLPPIDEQKRLADLLWAVEEHFVSNTTLADELAIGRRRAFKKWLSAVQHWSSLSQQYEVQLGKMLSPKSAPSTEDPGLPYLANFNVRWRSFEMEELRYVRLTEREKEKFRLRVGDVLVCEGGEIGRAAVWDGSLEECYYQKALHRLRPIVENALPADLLVDYLELLAQEDRLAAHSTGTTFAHLTRERLMEIELPNVDGTVANKGSNMIDSFSHAQTKVIAENEALRRSRLTFLSDIFGGSP